MDFDFRRAVSHGNVEACRRMIADDESIVYCVDPESGFSNLHVAARHGSIELVAMFMELDCDVNLRTTIGEWTPLHHACFYGFGDIAAILIDGGADVNAKNVAGFTPT